MKKFVLLLVVCLAHAHANLPTDETMLRDLAKNYGVFFETGTLVGSSVNLALRYGFKEVHSMELACHYYERCEREFRKYPNVHIYHGDSKRDLLDRILAIHEPIVFFLDAHYSAGDTAKSADPLMDELRQIGMHPIKTHVIMIDDIRGQYLKVVQNALLEINPNYEFQLVDCVFPNDVLIAKPKK